MIIVCSGYRFTYPFLPELHADDDSTDVHPEKVLVRDGNCTLNLHKDISHLPDPTLAFAEFPLHLYIYILRVPGDRNCCGLFRQSQLAESGGHASALQTAAGCPRCNENDEC